MNLSKTTLHPQTNSIWARQNLLNILTTALKRCEYRFARQTGQNWLRAYPGDLKIQFLLAQAWLGEQHPAQARNILQNIVNTDPEYEQAQTLLAQIDTTTASTVKFAAALNSSSQYQPKGIDQADWAWIQSVQQTRAALRKNDTGQAEKHLQNVLTCIPFNALGAITHLQTLKIQPNTPLKVLQNLAEFYHQRWPGCVQFMLILAETLMDTSETDQAVSLLHQAVTRDVCGQVAVRLWGPNHVYQNLWPPDLQAALDLQIPSTVAAELGWNLLYEGEKEQEEQKLHWVTAKTTLEARIAQPLPKAPLPKAPHPKPQSEIEPGLPDEKPAQPSPTQQHQTEMLKSVRDELNQIARKIRRPDLSEVDGSYPIYLIFTSRKGLEKKYGVEATQFLDAALFKLATAIRSRMDWGSAVVYADEANSMAEFGLASITVQDAWQFKHALTDIDDALHQRGARIGALLIIGGHDVVPFHLLPNPTDDSDPNVPSDNPYSTRNENYFIPDWPVSRLPGNANKDPGLLLQTLREITQHHIAAAEKPRQSWFSALLRWLEGLFSAKKPFKSSFGYSAQAWQHISSLVFKKIGTAGNLITSPPVMLSGNIPVPPVDLGYFNLHGVADAPEWFGQKDVTVFTPSDPGLSDDYPVAIHPKDIPNSRKAPKIIFSEACFGAHIINKTSADCMALKFLQAGCQALVGSTVISYGSVTPPLNAADLLAKSFWHFLTNGHAAGEALRLAKIELARQKNDKNGFLDGEEQKTLISFVLYGDPLTRISELPSHSVKKSPPVGVVSPKEIKTICDRADVPGTSEPIPDDVIQSVKRVVEKYLPGMQDAHLILGHSHANCNCQHHNCPTRQLGAKSKPGHNPEQQVVTLSKQVVRAQNIHETYARVTLNKEGKVVKLAVSR